MAPINRRIESWPVSHSICDLASCRTASSHTQNAAGSLLPFHLATGESQRISNPPMLGFLSQRCQRVKSGHMKSNMATAVPARSSTSVKEPEFMTSRPVTNASDCEGCPEPPQTPSNGGVASEVPGRPPRASGQGWVVWTGGPPEAHLASLCFILPPGMLHVRIHPDGSIEYIGTGPDDWEPPSPIDGYERDAVNQRLYRPLWKSCQYRYFSVIVKEKCQCLEVIAKCGNPQAANANELVKCGLCNQCGDRVAIPQSLVPKRKTLL